MPYYKDLAVYANVNTVEDIDKYNKYPFFLVNRQAKIMPDWQIMNALFGKVPWKENMGNTMRNVQVQPSPIIRQEFYPNPMTVQPNKDIIELAESYEDASLSRHYHDSFQFNFRPSFADFLKGNITALHDDMVKKIAIDNDLFTRSYLTQKCPNVYIPGNQTAGEDELIQGPTIPSGTAISAATVLAGGKNVGFWQAQIAKIQEPGLSLATLDTLTAILRDDLDAPPFEGTLNTPKDNELVKGKYVFLGSQEAWQCLKYDPNFTNWRNVNIQVTNDGFKGSLFDMITWKSQYKPQRFLADGTQPEPETFNAVTKITRPNPAYVSAPFELGWALGADVIESIKVGPPPKPFSSGKMDAAKFFSMSWNGEVYMTDQLIINYINAAGNAVPDLNYRAEMLKFYSSSVYGAIPIRPFNAIAVLYERVRPGKLNATATPLE